MYMAAMGAEGMAQAASLCASKAAYLRNGLKEAGFLPVYGSRPFFHEFVTTSPVPAGEVEKQLETAGILGGLPLAEDRILWCCTEKNSREDMDEPVSYTHLDVYKRQAIYRAEMYWAAAC